jgi:hypothetical protein
MNAPFPNRVPWVMLALFCAAALVLFVMAVGRDLGLIGDGTSEHPATSVREVRMQIVHDSPSEPRLQPTDKPAGTTLLHPPAAQGQVPDIAGRLLSHRFNPTDTRFEAAFLTDLPAPETRVFFRSSPAIWVVDLPGIWKNASPREVSIDHGPIARVVIGEHEDFLRIVFHHRDKQRHRPAELPAVTREHSGFSVVISH